MTDGLPGWALEQLRTARVAHLGILDLRGHPRVVPVTFVLAEGALWSAVDDKPKRSSGSELARVRFVRQRPEAALTVDHYDDDWRRLAWVQALGAIEIIDQACPDAPQRALAAKYVPYRSQQPAGPLLRLAVDRALWWRASD